jgi:uncharacterized repeat protein (TIGR04076 family)
MGQRRREMNNYKIEIEIYEGKGGQLRRDGEKIIYPDLAKEAICAWMYRGDGRQSYRVGQRFIYPDDAGKLCPWLLDSLQSITQVLRLGGTLPWRYEDTPYEKVIDPEGITTEFIRCIDPTASGIVVKVTRTKLLE